MFKATHARSMAEARWGTGGTTGYRTNRPGAFYYSCSGHGGFVIDARCLTQAERKMINAYAQPEKAVEIYNLTTGETRKLRGPDSRRNPTYRVGVETWREIEVFFFEEDCAWAIPVVLAGIKTKDMTQEAARDTFKRWFGTISNHMVLGTCAREDASETC